MAKVKTATLFECVACAHQVTEKLRPLHCEKCGRAETYSIIDVFGGKATAVRACDIVAEEPQRYQIGDCELDSLLLGGLVKPSTLVAFGRGGTGKSRSCLRWATNLGTTLLVSLEMPSRLAVYSAQQSRADLSKLHVTESEDDWQSEATRVKALTVVLDSFHYSQKQRVVKGTKVPLICAELAEWAKATENIAFVICHSNKRNEVSGSTALEHWPDYLIKFAKQGDGEAKLTIPKSRYSPTGSCIVTI
jgi:predicted ATP-dependent serine protease